MRQVESGAYSIKKIIWNTRQRASISGEWLFRRKVEEENDDVCNAKTDEILGHIALARIRT